MAARAPAFELAEELGAGATGRVVHATLTRPLGEAPVGTEVAVKFLHAHLRDDPVARRAFELEASIGQRVRDPGLVHVFGSDDGEDGPLLIMGYVPGATLREVIEESGRLPEPMLRSVAAQVAGGLASLHAAGFHHGDVKPENMRLDTEGHAVLMDLGFASHAKEPDCEGQQAGSLAYLSPERARGAAASPAADVFALGVVMYELAIARHPFALDEPQDPEVQHSTGLPLKLSLEEGGGDQLLAAISQARFTPPSRVLPQLSPFLDQLLEEMLRRDPDQRPTSDEVHRRLVDQESGSWWRERLDLGRATPRGLLGYRSAKHLTPLVGREGELQLLQDLCREACSGGSGRIAWLTGPEGSGKSRLMTELAARARTSETPPLYLYGRCSPFEGQRPCTPILRLLERYLMLPRGTEPQARELELLDSLVPPAVAATLRTALSPMLTAGEAVTAVPVALAEWLLALGRSTPTLLFVDDLNFADEGTLIVIGLLADELEDTQSLFVLGYRESEPSRRPERMQALRERLEGAEDVVLAPLDEPAVLELVNDLFHPTTPRRRIAQVLWSRSRGNPGLLAEILRGLHERGQTHPFRTGPNGSPQLVLTMRPEDLPLPSSLGAIIADRFRKLSLLERSWVRRLAVVGGRIDREFLLEAFPEFDGAEVNDILSRLVESGWLVPSGRRYRFARPALREAVYRGLPDSDRRELHARAAQALGSAGRRIRLNDAFQRAFHLRAAGDHQALLRVLVPLIAALENRGHPQRIYTLARWGLEALGALGEDGTSTARNRQRIEFLEAAADAADRLGYREEQRQWLDYMSDLELTPEHDAELLARVFLLHGRHAISTGQYGLARGMVRNAVELAERPHVSRELLSESLRRLAGIQAHVGALTLARKLAHRALEVSVHKPQEAVSWLQIGIVDLLENRLEDALHAVDHALSLLRKAKDWTLPGVHSMAQMLRGRIYRVAGRPRRALASMTRAVRLGRQAGERRLEMEATARLGGLLLDANRPEEAELRLRDAQLMAKEIEDRRGQALSGLWLGILLWEQEAPRAEQELRRVARLANEMGLSRIEALALAIQARVMRARGRLTEALSLSARAASLARSKGCEFADRIVILGTRASILESSGDAGDAREIVTDLRERLRHENERIKNETTRRRHRVASTRLLQSVLSPEGVIYPRVRFQDSTEGLLSGE